MPENIIKLPKDEEAEIARKYKFNNDNNDLAAFTFLVDILKTELEHKFEQLLKDNPNISKNEILAKLLGAKIPSIADLKQHDYYNYYQQNFNFTLENDQKNDEFLKIHNKVVADIVDKLLEKNAKLFQRDNLLQPKKVQFKTPSRPQSRTPIIPQPAAAKKVVPQKVVAQKGTMFRPLPTTTYNGVVSQAASQPAQVLLRVKAVMDTVQIPKAIPEEQQKIHRENVSNLTADLATIILNPANDNDAQKASADIKNRCTKAIDNNKDFIHTNSNGSKSLVYASIKNAAITLQIIASGLVLTPQTFDELIKNSSPPSAEMRQQFDLQCKKLGQCLNNIKNATTPSASAIATKALIHLCGSELSLEQPATYQPMMDIYQKIMDSAQVLASQNLAQPDVVVSSQIKP